MDYTELVGRLQAIADDCDCERCKIEREAAAAIDAQATELDAAKARIEELEGYRAETERQLQAKADEAIRLLADFDAANERAKWMRRAHDAKVVIQVELERQLEAANERILNAACEAVRERCDHLPECEEAPHFDGALCRACRDAIAAIEAMKEVK